MKDSDVLDTTTVADIQEIAEEHIGRRLTEAEVHLWSKKFEWSNWHEDVQGWIDSYIKE